MIYNKESEKWKNASEIVMALVAPIGVDRTTFVKKIEIHLKEYGYKCLHIRLSSYLEEDPNCLAEGFEGEYKRIYKLMQAGNTAREEDSALLAKTAIGAIFQHKTKKIPPITQSVNKIVYIVDSIKHHAELDLFQEVYGDGFYLIALSADLGSREAFLLRKKRSISKSEALTQVRKLIHLDSDDGHGQEVGEFFHRSDYFIGDASNIELVENATDRFLKIIFNHPYVTPTFSEYAMHMAYVASTKSADMSRQVGSVITVGESIVSLGANDVPRAGGGTYWPIVSENGEVSDIARGRDYTNGFEANRAEILNIQDCIHYELQQKNPDLSIKDVEKALKVAGVASLTEFGRMLHAEMDSLLDCAKRGVSIQGSVMYVTTFPCHNCAKHIVGAGVKEVVFIEPYQKSKALELHSDSISSLEDHSIRLDNKVIFKPFVGLGPRYYMALYSMGVSRGSPKNRKYKNGSVVDFIKSEATPRLKLLPNSYIGKEIIIAKEIQGNSFF